MHITSIYQATQLKNLTNAKCPHHKTPPQLPSAVFFLWNQLEFQYWAASFWLNCKNLHHRLLPFSRQKEFIWVGEENLVFNTQLVDLQDLSDQSIPVNYKIMLQYKQRHWRLCIHHTKNQTGINDTIVTPEYYALNL